MFLYDLINHTCSTLPLFTDKFTDNTDISAVSKSGDTVTVTATAHGLSVDDVVIISGVKTTVSITDITTTDGIATATCATEHDVVVGYPKYVEIDSATSEYNGTFEVLTAPTLTTFTFKVTGTPGSGTGTLKTFHNLGFNGVQTVASVTDANTFTYTLENDAISTGNGDNMLVMGSPRISGGAELDRVVDSYTRQNTDELWGFFVLEEADTSNDRTINNDSKNERQLFEDFKLRIIQNASFYVFIPTHDEISGRLAMDNAQELLKPIYKTLAGFVPENPFITEQQTVLMPSNHQLASYNGSFLVYRYQFQSTEFVLRNGESQDKTEFMANTGDILPNFNTSAFKRFDWMVNNEEAETVKDDEFIVQN